MPHIILILLYLLLILDKYNQYVELVGGAIGQGACAAVRRGNRMYVIADDLPFLHFLSDSQVKERKWLPHTNLRLVYWPTCIINNNNNNNNSNNNNISFF